MGSMSDVYEKKVLDLIFRNTGASATVPMGLNATNVWMALFTVTPSDSAAGTEATGGSYARVAVARTGAGFDAATGASPGTTLNSGTITFPTATVAWGLCVAFAFNGRSHVRQHHLLGCVEREQGRTSQ